MLSELSNYEIIRLNYLNILSNRIQNLSDRLWTNMAGSVEDRIVDFILLHSIIPTGEKRLKIKMDDLAKLLSSTRIRISRALNEMQDKHWITLHRGEIRVPDFVHLKEHREARRLDGLQMVLTHADNPADQYTLEQQQEAVRAGAMVEHCYFTTYYNRVSAQEIARQIQGVGPEHVILSTDFGQVKSPYSDEGMLGYMEALYACGVSEDALVQMTRTNPQRLIAS